MLLLSSLAIASPTAAQPSAHDRAVELVTESARHYEAGRFDEAIELLDRAYGIEPSPTILYNLARAYEGKGELDRALEAYRRYLGEAPNAADRGSVEQRIATLERQLEEKAALERERDAAARRAEEARRQAREEMERAQRERQPAPSEPSVAPWIVGGVGLAVLIAGVALAARAEVEHQAAEEAALARDAADRNSRAKLLALLANISFGVGGVLVAGGVTWGLVDRLAPPQAAGYQLTLVGRF